MGRPIAMSDGEVAARFLVSGRVQGVFYRVSTQAEGQRLGLRGYARNLPDGRVEVLAAGPASLLDRLQAWLAEGPPAAAVASVERETADPAHVPEAFEVRR